LCLNDDGPITGGGQQWLDRAMARVYAVAMLRSPRDMRVKLIADQRRFLRNRDACVKANGCRMDTMYRARLRELAHRLSAPDAFAVFKGVFGELQLSRLGDKASVSIWVSENGYACQFEADDILVDDGGAARFRDDENGCRVDVVPEGAAMRVKTELHCYCGAHASMEGVYVRER
jgi:hypothetical protein